MMAFARRPYGPIALASALGILATPFAAAAIMLVSIDPMPADLALVMGLVAVLAGGLVGGLIGGLFVRRRPNLAAGLAVAVAWPAAFATLPITPTLFGQSYAAVETCINSCSPSIRSVEAMSAINAYILSLIFTATIAVPVAIILLLFAMVLGRRGKRTASLVLAVAAVVAINAWSMAVAWPAALALAVGVLVWVRPYRTPSEPAPA